MENNFLDDLGSSRFIAGCMILLVDLAFYIHMIQFLCFVVNGMNNALRYTVR